MKTAGWSTHHVAGQVDRWECAVRNCWQQWTREGTHARKSGSGATRKTTRIVDRRIVRQALVNPTVRRRPCERYNSPYTVLRHTGRTAGVMLWEVIACDSRSTLIMMRGTLTGQLYVDDILRPHVRPFLNGFPATIFQQDNSRPPHTARVARDFLRHFQTLP
ncbi:transposable element Tcb1 transposase [Trichonephila clavipes]|nr:transposable element Tcb1 transposase [Trichonephila clavipes]